MSAPHVHYIRAESGGNDTTASRCVALIERGIQKLVLTQRVGALQKAEFAEMRKNAQRPPVERKAARFGPERRLSDVQRLEMKEMRRAGIAIAAIAERFACSHTTVFRITGKSKGPIL